MPNPADQFMFDPLASVPNVPMQSLASPLPETGAGASMAQIVAMAREQRLAADDVLAQQVKQLDFAKKATDLADSQQKRAEHAWAIDKVTNSDGWLAQKELDQAKVLGRNLTAVESAQLRKQQLQSLQQSLAGNKDYAYASLLLADKMGTLEQQLRTARQQEPGIFRNLGGQAGALVGSVVSSLGDTLSGAATLLGATRSNLAVQAGDTVNAIGEKITSATATKEQAAAHKRFGDALNEDDIAGMISAFADAPAYTSAGLLGGIIGPAGVAGGIVKTAKSVETLVKFGSALEKLRARGGLAKAAAGLIENVPVAAVFGSSEAGNAARDAVAELQTRTNGQATPEQLDTAARSAAQYAASITAAGTILAPGLEKAPGAITRLLTGGAAAGKNVAKGTLGSGVRSAAKEVGAQSVEEGLVAEAARIGADAAQGRDFKPGFNTAAAVLGGAMGGAGSAAGSIAQQGAAVTQQRAADSAAAEMDAAQAQAQAVQQQQVEAEALAQQQQAAAAAQAVVDTRDKIIQTAASGLPTDAVAVAQIRQSVANVPADQRAAAIAAIPEVQDAIAKAQAAAQASGTVDPAEAAQGVIQAAEAQLLKPVKWDEKSITKAASEQAKLTKAINADEASLAKALEAGKDVQVGVDQINAIGAQVKQLVALRGQMDPVEFVSAMKTLDVARQDVHTSLIGAAKVAQPAQAAPQTPPVAQEPAAPATPNKVQEALASDALKPENLIDAVGIKAANDALNSIPRAQQGRSDVLAARRAVVAAEAKLKAEPALQFLRDMVAPTGIARSEQGLIEVEKAAAKVPASARAEVRAMVDAFKAEMQTTRAPGGAQAPSPKAVSEPQLATLAAELKNLDPTVDVKLPSPPSSAKVEQPSSEPKRNADAAKPAKPASAPAASPVRAAAANADVASVKAGDAARVAGNPVPSASRSESPRSSVETARRRLVDIANNLEISVQETGSGFHADRGSVAVPAIDTEVAGASTSNHVFAHELGHAIMQKRGVSFSGFPKVEMNRRIANYDSLVAISKDYRPDVHRHADPKVRRHATKPDEVIADAIAAVLLGEYPIEVLRPLMDAVGLTRIDLGLQEKAPRVTGNPVPRSSIDAAAALIPAKVKPALDSFVPKSTPEFVREHKAIADVYESLPADASDDPATQRGYEALVKETLRQYDAAIAGGLKVEAWAGESEPYPSSTAMHEDLTKNNHLYFLRTDAGFGSDGGAANHPLLSKTPYTVRRSDGKTHAMLANDVFRVVHDWLAHGVYNNQFGPLGEEKAWAVHMSTIADPDARRALTTETRGQNSWVNYGPHLRDADGNIAQRGEAGYVPPTQRPFAPQKYVLFPLAYSQPITEGTTGFNVASLQKRVADATFVTEALPSPEATARLEVFQAALTAAEIAEDGKARVPNAVKDAHNAAMKELDGGLRQAGSQLSQSELDAIAALNERDIAFLKLAQAATDITGNPQVPPDFTSNNLTDAAKAAIDANAIQSVLTNIATKGATPLSRAVAAHFRSLGLQAVNIEMGKVTNAKSAGFQAVGKYDPETKTVTVDPELGLTEHVVLHEIAHAATIEIIRTPSSKRTPAQNAAVKELERIYAQVQRRIGDKSAYGLTNLEEFVAEAHANPSFQQELYAMKDDGVSLIRQVFNAFMRLTGLDKLINLVGNDNLLGRTLFAADAILMAPEGMKGPAANYELRTKDAVLAATQSVKDAGKSNLNGALDWAASITLNVMALRDIANLVDKQFRSGGVNLIDKIIEIGAMRAAAVNTQLKKIDDTLVPQTRAADAKVMNEVMAGATQLQFNPDRQRKGHRAPTTADETRVQILWDNATDRDKKLFRATQAQFADQLKRRADAVEQQLLAAGVDAKSAKQIGDAARFAKLEVYFAQQRDGQYTNHVTDEAGATIHFSRHQSRAEADNVRAALVKAYPDDVVAGVGIFNPRMKPKFDVATEQFIVKVAEKMSRQGASEDVIQATIDTMRSEIAAASVNKFNQNQQTRKFVLGADPDLLTANLRAMRQAENNIASITFQPKTDQAIVTARSHIEALRRQGSPVYTVRADQALNTVVKSLSYSQEDSTMNRVANNLNALGFVHTMFGNISSAAVNTIGATAMQTAEITARYGISHIGKLAPAYTQVVQAMAAKKTAKDLTGDIKTVFDYAEKMGTFVPAEAREIADITNDANPRLARALRFGGWLMEKTDTAANMGMLLASYRAGMESPKVKEMARARGMTQSDLALQLASEARYRTNPDSSSSNKSYYSRMPVGRVVLQLKGYGIAVATGLYTDLRNAVDSARTPEERKYAATRLVGVVGMHALIAGAAGLPYMVTAPFMLLAGIAAQGVGDEEERDKPVKERIRNAIYETYGEGVGNHLYYGVLGAGVSSRVSLSGLVLRDPFGKEYNTPQDYAIQLLGPTLGAAESYYKAVTNFAKNYQVNGVGESMWQATQAGMPAAVGNIIKAVNQAENEGRPTQKDGTPILGEDRLTSVDMMMQALGFRPAALVEAQNKVSAVKALQSEFVSERRLILEGYRHIYHAENLGKDRESQLADAEAARQRFNALYPEKAIKDTDLANARKKLDAKASESLIFLPDADRKVIERRFTFLGTSN